LKRFTTAPLVTGTYVIHVFDPKLSNDKAAVLDSTPAALTVVELVLQEYDDPPLSAQFGSPSVRSMTTLISLVRVPSSVFASNNALGVFVKLSG